MDISIRCPHCGQVCAMKPEFVGREVRCGQCKQIFNVMASGPGGGASEPITLTLASTTAPSSAGALLDLLDKKSASAPTIERPRGQVGNVVLRRLRERKLPAAVAAVSLVLTLVFIVISRAVGMRLLFAIPPMAGAGLAALGFWLPVTKRRGRYGPWLDSGAVRIVQGSGVIGLVLTALHGIMVLAARSGHPIPRALGLSLESARTFGWCHFGAIGASFAVCFLTILVSVTSSLVRRRGLLGAAGILYLALVGSSIAILASLRIFGILGGPMGFDRPLVDQEPWPPMNRRPGFPPGWPRNSVRTQPGQGAVAPVQIQLPPGASDPSHPDFYRVNLAELRSADANHRMIAAGHLENAKPTQLRSEIVKALEETTHDSDSSVRAASLKALCVWTTDDPVLVAIGALKDPDFLFRNAAVEVLARRKDPRAIEPLIESLSYPSNWAALEYLKQTGPTVEDAVLKHYDGGNDEAKRAVIEILAAVATKRGIAKLREIAAGDDFMAAAHARMALQRRGESVADLPFPGSRPGSRHAPPDHSAESGVGRSRNEAAPDPNKPGYYEELARRLQSDDSWQRSKAIDLLLIGRPKKADAETRKQIARAFAAMTQTEHGEDQKKAVRGLALWAGNYGVPTLLTLLNKENRLLHETVLEALGALQDPRAAVPVAELLGDFFDKDAARKCLQRMGPAAEEGLVKVLYSEDPEVSLRAIKLLGEVGTPKCLPTLRDGLRSTNLSIRAATKVAIRKIGERERERKEEEAEENDKSQSDSSSDDT
jgi:HEAT repeat protein